MTDTQAELAPAASPKDAVAAPLGAHATRGAMWAIVQTFGSKGATIVSQLVLGYLLLEQAFGLAGLAFTFLALVGVTSRFGLTEVLVQRHEKFDHWATAAFWMSLSSGLFSCALVTTSAVLVRLYSHDNDLSCLIFLIGLTIPLDALTTCPVAKLQQDLRFRTQNMVNLLGNFLQAFLTILFAFWHWGPYAIIVPRPIVSLTQATLLWCVAPVPIRGGLDRKRWGGLFGDAGSLTTANYLATIVQFGDNLTLSLFHPTRVVGLYYFAFNLSTQTGQLVATSLTQTFLAIFSKLKHEVSRQAEAYLRAARVVAIVMIPLCMLQAAVAGPVLRFLWGHKWESAIPVLQVLSVGMAFASTQGITTALFQAQGRFRFQLRWQLLSAAVFLLCVLCGALSGGALAVAISVLLYDIVWYPLSSLMALRPAKVPLHRVVQIFMRPILYAGMACVVATAIGDVGELLVPRLLPWVITWVLPARVLYLLECVAISGLVLPVYGLLMCLLRPQDATLLINQLQPIFGRLGLPRRLLKIPGASQDAEASNGFPVDVSLMRTLEHTPAVKVLWMIDGNEMYGAQRAVFSLMGGLRARGWAVQAVSLQQGDCATGLERAGFDVSYLNLKRAASLHLAQGGVGKTWQAMKLVIQQMKLNEQVRRVVRESGADVIHVIDKNLLTVAAWAAKSEDKVCVWEMISIVGSGYPGDINQRMHAWLLARYDIVPLANSRYTAGTLKRVRSAVPVMHLGADSRQFDPSRRFEVTRQALGIPTEAPLFTIISRLDQSKGHLVFLEALLQVQRNDLHLLIVGALPGAPEVAALQAMAQAAGVAERLHFVEFTTEPEAYLAISDVVVNSRLDPEPFGLSTIEGMMMGKPLLVHALGGPAETVIDGESGWHVAAPTVEAFAAGIARALGDAPRWKAMGEAARQRALEFFSLEAQSRWYQQTVLQVMESRQFSAGDALENGGGS